MEVGQGPNVGCSAKGGNVMAMLFLAKQAILFCLISVISMEFSAKILWHICGARETAVTSERL
jgi:hypothetical protein